MSRSVSEDGEPAGRMTEIEPNDRPDDATVIALRGELRPMYGAIDPASDVDWFSLVPEDGQDWLVEVSVEPLAENLDVAVYLEVPGGGDHAPLMYDVAGPGEKEVIPMLGVPAEEPRRFFVTGADGNTGEYRIDVSRRLSAASVARAPNDYPHLASELEIPGEIQGFYDRPHDRHVFFVPAEMLQASIYSLELSAIPDLSQTLRIYGDEELDTTLLEIPVEGREPAVIPNLSLGAEAGGGLYFVLSAGENYDRDRGYRLRVIEHPQPDGYSLEREPNDTWPTAQPIEMGDRLRGYLHSDDDVDRFRLVVGDPDSGVGEASQSSEPDDDELIDPRLGSGQFDGSEPRQIIDPWEGVPEKEPRDHVVQVRLRPLSDAHRLKLGWRPDEGSELEPIEVQAVDPEQELVVCNQVVDDGEHGIEVSSVETDPGFRTRSFDYELEVVDLAELDELEIEPNDTPEQADRLPVGQRRIGFIASEGDVDYYAFVVGPDEPTAVEPDGGAAGQPSSPGAAQASAAWDAPDAESVRIHLKANRLNLGFELLDDEGGRVANVNRSGPGSDEILNIDLPQGLYYVAVRASAGSLCDPYEIRVMTR